METSSTLFEGAGTGLKPAFEGIIDFDYPSGAITAWNHQAEELFDWSTHEVLGRSFLETVIPPELRESLSNNLNRLADEMENEPDFSERIEIKAQRRDGSAFPLEMRIRPLKKGHFSVSMVDISDRRRNELAQLGQSRVFERLASRSPLPEILTALIQIIEIRFDVRASVLLVDADGKKLRAGSAPSLPDEFNQAVDGLEIGPCSGSCGTAAYRCDTVVIEDIKTDPLWAGFRELGLQSGIRSCWSQPILSKEGKVLGTLCMYYREARRPIPEEVELMNTCAKLASIAIENRKVISELESKAQEVEQYRQNLAARDERIRALKEELNELKKSQGPQTLHS